MKSSNILSYLTLPLALMVLLAIHTDMQAQSPAPAYNQQHGFDDGLGIGASLSFGGQNFESEYSMINDFYTNSVGYGLHLRYGYALSPLFSLNTGASLFVNRYSTGEERGSFTNETGEPTGPESFTSMAGTAGTTYAGLPINLVIRPLRNKSFYATLGPEFGFKVAHNNDIITTRIDPVPQEGDPYWGEVDEDGVLFVVQYDNPERSRNAMLFVNAGLGYSLDAAALPLDVALILRQAVTTYMDGDDYINSWLRHMTVSVTYRL